MSKPNMAHCNSESYQRQDFIQRSSFNSWRRNKPQNNEPLQISTRGSMRALESQYYNRSRRRQNKGSIDIKNDKTNRQSPIIKTIVQNLDLECVKPQRAGIILYTVVDGATYIGLGLDSRTHDLTDFAGHIEYGKDANCIDGSLREFHEETLSIFEPFTVEDISHCPVIYDNRNLIIFVHITIDPDNISTAFNEKYKRVLSSGQFNAGRRKHNEPEVCGITWLTWEEFQNSIHSKGIIYSRVQRFLLRADNFAYLL